MNFVKIGLQALPEVIQFYSEVTSDLRIQGIHQWDRFYPNRIVLKKDLKNGTLFGLKEENQLVGAIVLDTNESKFYLKLQWDDLKGRPLIIHRLAVHPFHQGKGLGKKLLHFAEEYAMENGHTSIRMDVYSKNPGAIAMYERAGYQVKGAIKFPLRKVPYLCFEKIIQK